MICLIFVIHMIEKKNHPVEKSYQSDKSQKSQFRQLKSKDNENKTGFGKSGNVFSTGMFKRVLIQDSSDTQRLRSKTAQFVATNIFVKKNLMIL
jgi:hypothetical protein